MVERPDLSAVDPDIVAYIEALEAQLQRTTSVSHRAERSETPPEPSEPPTTINMITVSEDGAVKRTPRHFYGRQRRGGMGVFDLQTAEENPPAFLVAADESQGIVLITNQGRAFRIPVANLPETPIHGRGDPLASRFPWREDERPAVVIPDQGGTHLVLVTERGRVRRYTANVIGPNLQMGTVLHDPKDGGAPAAACWSRGLGDLFIATHKGKGIRFTESQVPVRGCLGIRLDVDDRAIGIAATHATSNVLLITGDGKGTLRQMSGFTANKSPGSGGKTAMRTDNLVAAVGADDQDDVFLISRLGKIIRFQSIEIPPKEGVVQGVNCMSLRADEVMAAAVSGG